MLDLAQADGTVEIDEALMLVEQRLGVSRCLDMYGWLEYLQVIRRTETGFDIPNFEDHRGPVGITADSFAVLRRHLDSVGTEDLAPAIALVADAPDVEAETPVRVIAMRRWRRTVPIAAGIAASVAALAGASQLIPQAAVTGRNVALSADAPTSVVTAKAGDVAKSAVDTAKTSAGAVTSKTLTTSAPAVIAATPTTGVVAGVVCAVPQLVTAVTSVSIVQLPISLDALGAPIWAAVVSGTVTNTTADSVAVQGVNVIAHVVDGDSAPVAATLLSPLLLANSSAPFNAVIALGSVHPTDVSATAEALGNKSAC